MSERDELAAIIGSYDWYDHPETIAEAILDAGWQKPPTCCRVHPNNDRDSKRR